REPGSTIARPPTNHSKFAGSRVRFGQPTTPLQWRKAWTPTCPSRIAQPLSDGRSRFRFCRSCRAFWKPIWHLHSLSLRPMGCRLGAAQIYRRPGQTTSVSFALEALPHGLAMTAHRFRLLAHAPLRRLLVGSLALQCSEGALALHFLLEDAKRGI